MKHTPPTSTGKQSAVNIKRALSGEVEQVKESVLPTGTVGGYRDKLLEKIQKIDSFAEKKAADLYATSNGMKRSLNRQLILLVVIILIVSLTIYYILLRNIRTPLKDLTTAARRFREGDLEARSSYESKMSSARYPPPSTAWQTRFRRTPS
ncbi:MAG: hypothetical protein IPQ16_13475 [Geobacteraceae bacterium]|nr:hypothetical protein [Geobacteraceae bacterium]